MRLSTLLGLEQRDTALRQLDSSLASHGVARDPALAVSERQARTVVLVGGQLPARRRHSAGSLQFVVLNTAAKRPRDASRGRDLHT